MTLTFGTHKSSGTYFADYIYYIQSFVTQTSIISEKSAV